MKRIFLIAAVALLSMSAFSQTKVRVSSETVGFWTVTADTMQILETDNVIAGSVYCPSFASDSVHISGCTFTIDGIATNGISIPPGSPAVNFGFRYAISDTLTIIADDVAWVVGLIRR